MKTENPVMKGGIQQVFVPGALEALKTRYIVF